MKRDIKINYGTIYEIIEELSLYLSAINQIKDSSMQMKNVIDNSEGLAIDELSKSFETLDQEIELMYDEVNGIYVILSRYYNEMTSIMKPIVLTKQTRVSRNDIYWNMNSIANSFSLLRKSCNYMDSYTRYLKVKKSITSEKEKRNYEKVYNANLLIDTCLKQIDADIEDMWNIHNKKVIPYENLDDDFANQAKKLSKTVSNIWDRAIDFIDDFNSASAELTTGFFVALKDFVVGVFNLLFQIVKFDIFALIYLVTFPFMKEPDFVVDYFKNLKDATFAILKDPILIFEAIAQNASDTVEEKGFAYGIGYIGFDVALEIIGTKGFGKVGKIGKVADVAEDVGDVVDITEDFEDVTDVVDDFEVAGEAAKATSKLDKFKVPKTFNNWEDMKAFFRNSDDLPYITNFLSDYKPKNSPVPKNWFNKGGTLTLIKNADGKIVFRYSIDVDGSIVTVDYINGRVNFDPLATGEEEIQTIELSGDRKIDEARANIAARYDETPEDKTWHHDVECGKMVLIPTKIHALFTHQGGFSLC